MEQEKIKSELDWTEFWKKRSPLFIKLSSWCEHWVCLRLFKGLEVKTCLELGGGPGYLAELITRKMGYQMTLVENDPEAYKLFKKVSDYGNYVFKDFLDYKSEERFDLVFSFGVIEHYSEREDRLKVIKLHKELSRKYVAVFVPRETIITRKFFHYPEEKGFEKLYTREELKNELEKAGLKTVRPAQNLHVVGYLCRG